MALTKDILNPPVVAGGPHLKFSLTKEDFIQLGAFVTGDITLFTLPAGAIITRTFVKTTTAVTGVTTAVGFVKTANHNYGTTTYDLKAAVSATNTDLYATEQKENFEAVTPVLFHAISTVENLSAVTAGGVDIWIDYTIRN